VSEKKLQPHGTDCASIGSDVHQAPDDSAASAPVEDVALIHGRTDDGRGLKIIRRRDNQIEAGAVLPVEDGKPLQGDLVRLKPRKGFPLLCDVETEFALPDSARPRQTQQRTEKGPPRVTTDAYRRNWDTIWSCSSNKEELPN
jgi:hypothetical protein